MTASSGMAFSEARRDREFWGRLVESAVGAHLANAAAAGECEVFYWRDRNAEVDFVVRAGKSVTAIEVKSGRARVGFPGQAAFGAVVPKVRKLVFGAEGMSVRSFCAGPYCIGRHDEMPVRRLNRERAGPGCLRRPGREGNSV